MIFTTILGIIQNIIFIALMIDIVIVIYQLLSYVLGIQAGGKGKKEIMISMGVLIGIFYLDSIVFDIFKVHIVSFPIFLI
ncbi:MAG: hypothetical protein ACTSRG_17840 [Candidatus Helarchaeota archaeon]